MKKIQNTKAMLALFVIILLAANINTVFAKNEYDIEKENNAEKFNLQISERSLIQKLMVDDKEIKLRSYSIEGYNYFMLRDLACALKETNKHFHVDWDSKNFAINLETGRPYIGADIVLDMKEANKKDSIYKNTAKIYIDGHKSNIEGYKINDNTYFKLRDLAKEIGFGVGWNSKEGIILLSSAEIGALNHFDKNILLENEKSPQAQLGNKDQKMRESMLELINQARKKEGLKSLTLDKELIEMATYKVKDMKKTDLMSHSGSYGELKDLLNKFKIDYSTAGENLLKGCTCEVEMFELWWNSPGHRANMMNPKYNKIGIAFEGIDSTNRYWAVQEFTD